MIHLLIFFIFYFCIFAISKPIHNYPNEIDSNSIQSLKQRLAIYSENSKEIISEFKLNSSDHEEIKITIKKLFPQSISIINNKKNTLIIKHKKNEFTKIKEIIENFDQPTIQAYLKCRIYEVSTDNHKEIDFLNKIINGPHNISYENKLKILNTNSILDSIKMLESKGNAFLISQPSIKLHNKKESTIIIGNKIPYTSSKQSGNIIYQQINSFQTGINLKIIPVITKQNILCNVKLKLTHVKNWKIINNQELPILSNRELNNSIDLRFNEPKLIGGYTKYYEASNKIFVPFIKNIPLLKNIFYFKTNQKAKSFLLVFFEIKK